MNLNKCDVRNYVENFLNTIFKENIKINIVDEKYIINDKIEYKIYEFWKKSDEILIHDFNHNSFKGDFISTIFFFLSGYWEYTHTELKDKHGRFLGANSFAYKKDILEKPIVDLLVRKIAKGLNIKYKNFFRENKIFMTHDIDFLGMYRGYITIKDIGGDIIKRKNVKVALDKITKLVTLDDPHSVNNLIEMHKRYDTKATFFFMADKQPKDTVGGYKPQNNLKKIKKIKDEIKSIDGSIGIHYDARYLKTDRMEKDINILEGSFKEKIYLGRAHFLKFDIKKSFDIYENAGIKLDSTGCYADKIGFRFGTSYPFKPYNFKEKREYDLLEVPLIIMESTLQSIDYMNLSPKEASIKMKDIINQINEVKGVFTFLWHNSSFYTSIWKEWEWLYIETIKYAKKKNNKFMNADEILERFI